MPAGVEVLLDDGFATIDFVDRSLRGPGLQKLLDVGGPETIETLTREGPRRTYRVPAGNAAEAGLLDAPAKKAAAKESPAKGDDIVTTPTSTPVRKETIA